MSSPLDGKRILVAASEGRAERLSDLLRKAGADVVPLATVRIRPPKDRSRLDEALRRWASYDWVVFTSANGVGAVASRGRELALALGRPPRIAAVGPATRAAAAQAGFVVDAMPDEFLTDAIAEALGSVEGHRILMPRSRLARKSLAERLRERGAHVDDVDAYDATLADPEIPEALRSDSIRLVVFTSASAVDNLVRLVPFDVLHGLREHADAACIGPVTAAAAERNGFRVTFIARDHTIPGIVRELQEAVVHG